MFLKGLRRAKNRETLAWHVQQMSSLEATRTELEREGQRGMVLAVNYELVSHATRALAALRKLEELGGSLPDLRRYLLAILDLPAVPRSELNERPKAEIDRLFEEYQGLGQGQSSTQPGTPPSSGIRQLDPSSLQVPERALERALNRWVEVAGFPFPSEDHLSDTVFQLQGKWILMKDAVHRGEFKQHESEQVLEQLYTVAFHQPGNQKERKQREGWIAAHLELQQAFDEMVRGINPGVGDETLCTKESIISDWGISLNQFELKYASYEIALKASGQSSHWNDEIDDWAREIGALTEREIQQAHSDLHQAILNRIQVSLAAARR